MYYDVFAYIGLGASIALGIAAGTILSRLVDAFLKKINDLEGRIAKLESVQAARLPHRSAAGIEDAMAVMIDLARSIDDEELDIQARKQRIDRAMRILQMVRKDPDRYDLDEPNGVVRRKNNGHTGTEKT